MRVNKNEVIFKKVVSKGWCKERRIHFMCIDSTVLTNKFTFVCNRVNRKVSTSLHLKFQDVLIDQPKFM